jgi:glycosyltransferase involved in cell wall biosynthesis
VESATARVYIQSPKWFIRPQNTDWRYTRFTIPRIHEFAPECSFYAANSNSTLFHANRRYLRLLACRKLNLDIRLDHGSVLDRREFAHSGCDFVFCHDDFPRNAESIPVVWQNSILDPAMVKARGASEDALAAEYARKRIGFEKARLVQVSTRAEEVRLGTWFPEIAEKFVAIPFFLPDVQSISSENLEEKVNRSGILRCLFVGHEAKRKGLARVYDAISGLPQHIQNRVHLTVVSSQTDGRIPTPAFPNLKVCDALPHDQVQELIRQSDVLLMPSLFESYGLVYLEAMAQGTIPIVPDWEVQRELVDYGNAGIIFKSDSFEISQALQSLYNDIDLRRRLAFKAKERFEEHFAPAVVAKKFRSMFQRIIQTSSPSKAHCT